MFIDELTTQAHRRTRAVVAVAIAVLVALATAVAALLALAGPAGGPSRVNAAAPPGADSVPPAPGPDGSGPPPTGPPDAAAAGDLTWITVAGATVPVSRTAGPRDMADGRARGFSHDERGAVFAAAHLTLRLTPQVGPAVFGPTLREQVVGPDAAALAQHTAADYDTARQKRGLPYGGPAGRLYSTIVGFRIDATSPTTTTVRLLLDAPGPDGATLHATALVHLQWLGADWALVAPPRGDWHTAVSTITDTTGYLPLPQGG